MVETFQLLFTEEWAIRALISSSIVGITCGLLGSFIVLRNMALIGDALAHAILPGVVVAFSIVGMSTVAFFIGSVAAGLITAIIITWIQGNVNTKNDAAIGIVFTTMFAIGVIGISAANRQPGVHLDLKDFLFGTTLGINNEDIYLLIGIGIYVVVSVIVFYRYLFVSTFQPVIAETMGISVRKIHYFLMMILSFMIVASLKAVGIILVVAMLITPASTALLLSNKLQNVLVISSLIGFLSAVTGMILAIQYDSTPGPMMAVMAAVFYTLAVLFAPKKGLVLKRFRNRQLRNKIHLEDTLKQAFRLQSKDNLTFKNLQEQLGYNTNLLRNTLNKMVKQNIVQLTPELALTPTGHDQANKLVRAHRLWETYLVNAMGLSAEQIHEDAEKYEHLLTDAMLDEVDAKLGFPKEDPHGSPIPPKGQ